MLLKNFALDPSCRRDSIVAHSSIREAEHRASDSNGSIVLKKSGGGGVRPDQRNNDSNKSALANDHCGLPRCPPVLLLTSFWTRLFNTIGLYLPSTIWKDERLLVAIGHCKAAVPDSASSGQNQTSGRRTQTSATGAQRKI